MGANEIQRIISFMFTIEEFRGELKGVVDFSYLSSIKEITDEGHNGQRLFSIIV